MRKLFRRGAAALGRISLVDWFLLLFMAVLLGYTVYHLFVGAPAEESNAVDVIVRTSAAGIFGYFLSGSSLETGASSSSGSNTAPPAVLPGPSMEPQAHAQLGFSLSSDPQPSISGGASSSSGEPKPSSRSSGLQITIVSCIGLISLCLLFVMRTGIADSPAMTAAASQLRDFVSASVGFLVSIANREHG